MNRFPLLVLIGASVACAADIRLGIVGIDTSHSTALTKLLNDAATPDHIAFPRVTAAYKGGSPDIEERAKRVACRQMVQCLKLPTVTQ